MAATSAISTRIINEEPVNQDVIRGGICLYLLLGILWYFFYQIILFFDAKYLGKINCIFLIQFYLIPFAFCLLPLAFCLTSPKDFFSRLYLGNNIRW